MTTPTQGVWAYPETAGIQGDLTGYKVEAIDGDIGKIDEASNEVGSACIVVDTGPWIFGKKVMIPAGIVRTSTRTPRRSSSTGRRTRSRTRPSSTRTSSTILRIAASSAPTTATANRRLSGRELHSARRAPAYGARRAGKKRAGAVLGHASIS